MSRLSHISGVFAIFAMFCALGASLGEASAAAPKAWRLAVLAFDNAAPDPAWDALGKGLQSMMTTDLAEVASDRDDVSVVERARLAELQAELALGQSGAVDVATAARIGKLAGATHLVAGSFTVVGAKMRLDARVVDVASGEVSATADVAGESEAFFELEKDLVRKLMDVVGVKLAPQTRARLAAIHTADLEAFRAFSEGVAAFDAKRYDVAVDALKRASRIDPSFALASRTLSDYERLVADTRTHADAARQAEVERARLQAAQAAGRDQVLLDRLRGVREPGGPTDQPVSKDPVVRAVAALMLADFLDPVRMPRERFDEVRDAMDPFELERMSDRWTQVYVAEARALKGKLPLLMVNSPHGVIPLPDAEPLGRGPRADAPPATRAAFDGWLSRMAAEATKSRGSDFTYAAAMVGERLWLSHGERAALAEEALLAMESRLDEDARVRARRRVAEDYLKVGRPDDAARVLLEIRKLASDSKTLDEVAQWLAWGRDLKEALERTDALAPWRREYLTLARSWPPTGPLRKADKAFVGDSLGRDALRELNHARQLRMGGTGSNVVVVGSAPLFPVERVVAKVLLAGATDRTRAKGLRYFWSGTAGGSDRDHVAFLGVLGGLPAAKLDLRFTLDPVPAADWFDSSAERLPEGARPEVYALVGARDLLATSSSRGPNRPLTALGVRLLGGPVALVEIAEIMPRKRARRFEVKEVAETRHTIARRTDVHVALDGTRLAVSAGGEGHTFTLAKPADGFAGLLVRGPGYAGIYDASVAY